MNVVGSPVIGKIVTLPVLMGIMFNLEMTSTQTVSAAPTGQICVLVLADKNEWAAHESRKNTHKASIHLFFSVKNQIKFSKEIKHTKFVSDMKGDATFYKTTNHADLCLIFNCDL